MGFAYMSVIPPDATEVNATQANYTCPTGAVGFRVNDVTAGSSVSVVTAGGTTVTFDNLSNGEDVVILFSSVLAAGTDCASIHVFHD